MERQPEKDSFQGQGINYKESPRSSVFERA